MSARLDHLRSEFTKVRDGIDAIEGKATAEGRDLSDAEQRDVDALYARAEQLSPDIEAEGAKADRMNAAAAVLAKIGPAAPVMNRAAAKEIVIPSAGEYLSAYLRAKNGDADAELLLRSVATQTTSDSTGVLPAPIVGEIIKFADSRRPCFSSMTGRPMPGAGKTFSRPRITQRVQVAEQANELDELASRKMVITGDPVNKRTFAGTLELSRQDVDWTDPSVLQVVIDDFVDTYSEVTEAAAVTAMNSIASVTDGYDYSDIKDVIRAYTLAVATIYSAAKRLPDTVWLTLGEMMHLTSSVNSTTNESAISLLRQALRDAGINLNFIVTPGLSATVIGSSTLVEAYEQQLGLLSLPDITHLGVNNHHASSSVVEAPSDARGPGYWRLRCDPRLGARPRCRGAAVPLRRLGAGMSFDLKATREAIGRALDMSVWSDVAVAASHAEIDPPCLIVDGPDAVRYSTTYGGKVEVDLSVALVVSAADLTDAQDRLDDARSTGTRTSVFDRLSCADSPCWRQITVVSCGPPEAITIGAAQCLAVAFKLSLAVK